MRSFTKRILSLVSVFILSLFVFLPMMNVKAIDAINNVSIKSNGEMKWNNHETADTYKLAINGQEVAVTSPANVINEINALCGNGLTCEGGNNSGTYTLTLNAYSEETKVAEWTGSVIFDGEKITNPLGVHVLTIHTDVQSCHVEYNLQNYDDGDTLEIPVGEEVRLYGKASQGYGYVGMSTSDTTITENGSLGIIITMPDNDVNVYYNFAPTYVVTFETGEGSEVPSQTVLQGLHATEPTAPTRTDYVFGGWYEDSTYTTPFDFEDTSILANKTVYAKWNIEINNIVITGVVAPISGAVPTTSGITTTTENVTINGFNTFWMYKANGEGDWAEYNGETFVAGNIYGIHIMCDPAEGYGFGENVVATVNGEQALEVVPWGINDSERMVSYSYGMLAESNTVTVTIDVNGGNAIDPNTFVVEKGTTLAQFIENLNINPTHSNPNMVPVDGIFVAATGDETYPMDYVINSDVTFYVHWRETSFHTVTFNTQKTGTDADLIETQVEHGTTNYEFPPDPIRDGYRFEGWFADSTCTTLFDFENTPVTQDVTVYAKWVELLNSVAVTLTAPYIGDTVTLTNNEPDRVPQVSSTEQSITFVNPAWVTSACASNQESCGTLFSGEFEENTYYYAYIVLHGESKALTDDTEVTVNGNEPLVVFPIGQDGDLKLVARIMPVEAVQYTLTFDVAGGTPIEPIVRNANETIDLPEPSKTGSEFVEWQEWDSESHPVGGYHAGDQFIFTEDTTLHAIWNDPVNTHTVTFDTRVTDTDADLILRQVEDGQTIGPLEENPSKENYVFGGWCADSLCSQDFDFTTPITADVTIYARWREIITNVDLTLAAPVAGSSASNSGVNVSSTNTDVSFVNPRWVEGVCSGTDACETAFTGDFEEGTNYYALITLHSDNKVLTNNTVVTINGGPTAEIFNVGQDGDLKVVGVVTAIANQNPEPSFTVTYDFNGGTRNGEGTYVTESVAFAPDITAANFMTVAGVEVVAPQDKELDAIEINGTRYELNSSYMLNQNTTYRYLWKDINNTGNHTVTFNTNGGSSIDAQVVAHGGTATRPANNPTRNNYAFVDWYSDSTLSTLFDFSTEITEDTTIYAKWNRVYYIEIDYNGGMVGTETGTNLEVLEGQTIPEPTGSTVPTKSGYEFVGWSLGEVVINENTGAGTPSYYNFSQPVAGSFVLYANWKKIYTVTYNTGDVMPNPAPVQVLAGDVPNYPIPNPVPTTVGDYEAEGVYTDSEFTTQYNDEPITQDTILYIKWEDTSSQVVDETEITEINLTIPAPKVGETVETPKDEFDEFLWDDQTNQASITVPSGAHYMLDGDRYMYWVLGFEGEDYDTPFVGEFEENKTYYADIHLVAEDGYHFAPQCTIKINGKVAGTEIAHVFMNGVDLFTVGAELKAEKEIKVYEILDGANQVHDLDTDGNLTVRADGALEDLVEVRVDDQVVEASNYELSSGSTIITLKASYLNTLSSGTHTLTLVYNDGTATTNFGVTQVSENASGTSTNPQTSDNIMIWVILLIVSTLGMSFGVIKLRKN